MNDLFQKLLEKYIQQDHNNIISMLTIFMPVTIFFLLSRMQFSTIDYSYPTY